MTTKFIGHSRIQSLVWNMLHVTILSPRIWKWLLYFFLIFGIPNYTVSKHSQIIFFFVLLPPTTPPPPLRFRKVLLALLAITKALLRFWHAQNSPFSYCMFLLATSPVHHTERQYSSAKYPGFLDNKLNSWQFQQNIVPKPQVVKFKHTTPWPR